MPIQVRIPDDLRDRIDAVRGKVKREPWIRAALSLAIASPTVLALVEKIATHDDTGADRDG